MATVTQETPTARRIVFDVGTWPGNDAGQHLDLRLTADDGYQATRSYSIATSGRAMTVTIAVDRVDDGEVSPFLVDAIEPGDLCDVYGPLGGWFIWRPTLPGTQPRPVQLIAAGSGIVPIAAMIDAHTSTEDPAPFRLLYAVRTPADIFFRSELDEAARDGGTVVDFVYSRRSPEGSSTPTGRLTREVLQASIFAPDARATVFVCGGTSFVEQVLTWLEELGHSTATIRAERFGGTR